MEMLREVRRGMARGFGILIVLLLGAAGLLWAQSLEEFTAGDLISASKINANFQLLRGNDAPVGTILAWHKNLSGTPALSADWVECNGQTISDPASPYNGVTLPNLNSNPNAWNGGGRFLRGGTTPGVFQNDFFQGHTHVDPGHSHTYSYQFPEFAGATPVGVQSGGGLFRVTNTLGTSGSTTGITDPTAQSNGTARYGDETRPVNMSVVWIIRIK